MLEEQVVAGNTTQWRRAPRPYLVVNGTPRLGPPGSVVMRVKMYLPGSDGGPFAVLASFPEGTGSVSHVHTRAQFQLITGGSMQFPDERLKAPAVQYSDHCWPHGGFTVTEGNAYHELNANRAGQIFMEDAERDKEGKGRLVNWRGRYISREAAAVPWQDVPGRGGLRRKVLIPESEGPWAAIIDCPPDVEVPSPIPVHGQFQIVLAGAVCLGGKTLGPESLRFIRGREAAAALRAGPSGATVAVLAFDEDADWQPGSEVLKIEQPGYPPLPRVPEGGRGLG